MGQWIKGIRLEIKSLLCSQITRPDIFLVHPKKEIFNSLKWIFFCSNLLTVADFCISSSVLLDQVIIFLWFFFCMSSFLNLFLCLLPLLELAYVLFQVQHPKAGRIFWLRFHQFQTDLSSQFLSLTDDGLHHIVMNFFRSQQPQTADLACAS